MYIIYITILNFILLFFIIMKVKNSFFIAQDSSWYPLFLEPVTEAIDEKNQILSLLDIGTGTGKLLDILNQKNPKLKLTGIDTNAKMIVKANKKLKNRNILFHYQETNSKLNFNDNEFDVITICSVLFLLDDKSKYFLLKEAERILKTDGKIIILTPLVENSVLQSFIGMWQFPPNINNWTFIIWKIATRKRAVDWKNNDWLSRFSNDRNLELKSTSVFNNHATMDILTRSNNK